MTLIAATLRLYCSEGSRSAGTVLGTEQAPNL